jgi:hypothetical protein
MAAKRATNDLNSKGIEWGFLQSTPATPHFPRPIPISFFMHRMLTQTLQSRNSCECGLRTASRASLPQGIKLITDRAQLNDMLAAQAVHCVNRFRTRTLRQAEHGSLQGAGAGNLGIETIDERYMLVHGASPI